MTYILGYSATAYKRDWKILIETNSSAYSQLKED